MTLKFNIAWENQTPIPDKSFKCGYCGEQVASHAGYQTGARSNGPAFIYICHMCNQPTYWLQTEQKQTPGARTGAEVKNLPVNIAALYNEARDCIAASANTAAVLVCRKLLMNVAVDLSAPPNKTFVEYVKYLSDNHYIPPNAQGWVDHIRNKGNEANHEIHLMSQTDAKELISLAEMLLKIVYEFPARVPTAP